jgi:hypothetical protein
MAVKFGDRSLICSTGKSVRFDDNTVCVVDALMAILPQMTSSNGVRVRLQHAMTSDKSLIVTTRKFAPGYNGAPFYTCDRQNFMRIVEYCVAEQQQKNNDSSKRGRDLYHVDWEIVSQVEQAFDKWNGKTWFPPRPIDTVMRKL